jgi:hypothetical protein
MYPKELDRLKELATTAAHKHGQMLRQRVVNSARMWQLAQHLPSSDATFMVRRSAQLLDISSVSNWLSGNANRY